MKEKLQNIKLLIVDIDGVMTSGEITFTANGDEIKTFNSLDGAGVKYWQRMGNTMAVITGRESNCVLRRMKELGVDPKLIYQGYKKKLLAFEDLKAALNVQDEECAYIGDDLPDLPVMKRVACPIAVQNAVKEVKDIAMYVTSQKGGQGAVRESIEYLLKAQNKWDKLLETY